MSHTNSARYPQNDVLYDSIGTSVISDCALLLTIVHPNCGPRSLKYMVAVVPTGRFCKISSSLSDFPSEKQGEKHIFCTQIQLNLKL